LDTCRAAKIEAAYTFNREVTHGLVELTAVKQKNQFFVKIFSTSMAKMHPKVFFTALVEICCEVKPCFLTNFERKHKFKMRNTC
jgi:hypothetical protein